MIGPGATPPSDNSDQHPLRAALAFGDKLLARNANALESLLLAQDRPFLTESIVSQIQALIASLARGLVGVGGMRPGFSQLLETRLIREETIRTHCHALALEWRLTTLLEATLGIDPVLSPSLQKKVAHQNTAIASTAMAALTAQARFAQCQNRMELPLSDLPAELFHLALVIARDCASPSEMEAVRAREASLRSGFDEGRGRLTIQAQLSSQWGGAAGDLLDVRHAGVGLWLSALAVLSGESRDQISFATVEPLLGRLLLTLRAAGASPSEAETQALLIEPDASLPRGLHEIGTREAAQWLAQTRRDDRA